MSKGGAIRWTPERLAEYERTNASIKKRVTDALREPLTPTGQQRMQALGRMRDGSLNKTEARFAAYLESEKAAGRIIWYKFEAVKLRLADKTFYTADFFALNDKSELVVYEVKGARAIFADDARVKTKCAAEAFPFAFFVVYPNKSGGWDIEEV